MSDSLVLPWTSRLPAQIVDLQASSAVPDLISRYGNGDSRILAGALSHALLLGAKTGLIEFRYIDRDFRSEFTSYYARAYRQLPSVTHRMHFFADSLPSELFDSDVPAPMGNWTYLGYIVLRPVPSAPVGRTMLRPPARSIDFATCLTDERVNLFGFQFEVRAMPFIAQDAHFGICAHADSWMISYYHYLRFRDFQRVTPDRLLGDSKFPSGLFPSSLLGLGLDQVRRVLRRANLPTFAYRISDLKPGEVSEIACRYLDSGFPCVLGGRGHSLTVIGYRRVETPLRPRPRIEFLVHDDELGLYRQFGDRGVETYKPWEFLIVPLPEKVWLPGEFAETIAKSRAFVELRESQEGSVLLERLAGGDLRWRTVAVESTEFKSQLASRGATVDVAVNYGRMPFPRWLWVVELVSPGSGGKGPKVLGELIVDATGHSRDSHVLAWRLAGRFVQCDPDMRTRVPVRVDSSCELEPLRPRGKNGVDR